LQRIHIETYRMRERGLSVLGPRGDIHLSPVRATDDPGSIGEKAGGVAY
jgi:hypothetical protein